MTAPVRSVRAAASLAEPVPFHRADIDDDDIAGVVEVLRSGWLTTGARCRAFEQDFSERLGGEVHALAVSSCTAALHLALEALGIGPGDHVLTSTYTFTATAEVVRHLGAHPVLVDVDEGTGNLTADAVEQAYRALPLAARQSVKAVVPVHFAGLACDLTSLVALADRYGWAVVDDAAHALPSTHGGLPVGRWGDATAFSFYATKTLCTGEGGMVVTSRADLADRMRVMRLHGISRDAFDRYVQPDAWRYEVVAPGFKYNMTDMAAALGISQLRRLDQMWLGRSRVSAAYDVAFAGLRGLWLPAPATPGDVHARHLYPVRIDAGAPARDELVRELARHGIGTSVHFIPLHLQPYYRDLYGLRPEDFPNATRLFEQELSLPIFPGMTDRQVAQVVEAVPAALEQALTRVG